MKFTEFWWKSLKIDELYWIWLNLTEFAVRSRTVAVRSRTVAVRSRTVGVQWVYSGCTVLTWWTRRVYTGYHTGPHRLHHYPTTRVPPPVHTTRGPGTALPVCQSTLFVSSPGCLIDQHIELQLFLFIEPLKVMKKQQNSRFSVFYYPLKPNGSRK